MTLLICRTCPRYDPRATGRVQDLLSLAVKQALAVPLDHAEAAADNDEDGDAALGVLAVINKHTPHGFDLGDHSSEAVAASFEEICREAMGESDQHAHRLRAVPKSC